MGEGLLLYMASGSLPSLQGLCSSFILMAIKKDRRLVAGEQGSHGARFQFHTEGKERTKSETSAKVTQPAGGWWLWRFARAGGEAAMKAPGSDLSVCLQDAF